MNYSHYTSVSALLKGLEWSPVKDHRRDIRLTFLLDIVKGKVAVQVEGSLVAAGSCTRKRHDHKYRHLCYSTVQKLFSSTNHTGLELLAWLLCQGGYCCRLQGATAPQPPPPPHPPHPHTRPHPIPHRRDTLHGLSINIQIRIQCVRSTLNRLYHNTVLMAGPALAPGDDVYVCEPLVRSHIEHNNAFVLCV